MKKLTYVLVLGAAFGLLGFAAMPTAQAVEKTEAFICPVLGGQAGENGNATVFANPGGAFFTILGPVVSVPTNATNDDGDGSPGGPFLSPGDVGYTAIWATPTP